MHLALTNWLALCLPTIAYEGLSSFVYTLTSDDWTGYVIWLVVASVIEVWARSIVICVVRGARFSSALVTALRRPVLAVFVIVSLAEPWLTDFASSLAALPLFFAGSVVIFVTMLALVGTVTDGVPPLRALAYWLREMCRPRRLGINLTGALVVACLTVVVPDILAGVPGADWTPLRYAYVLYDGLGDAFAMVFVVLWYDAALDDRYGRDIERGLDAKPASISSGA